MNLEEEIKSRHTTEKGTVFVNTKGEAYARFDSDQSAHSLTAEYEILRADLGEIFLQAAKKTEKVRIVYGDSIKGLEQTGSGVNVTFANMAPETFDVVVAADGSTSTTRSMILEESLLKDTYRTLGQYVAFFSVPHMVSDTKTWHVYNTTKGRSIMLRPHNNPDTMGAYLCFTMPAREHRDLAMEEVHDKGVAEKRAAMRGVFQGAGWQTERILDGMDNADDFYMTRVAQVKVSKWANGRVALLGDAAHATFGIATSLAIEGGYVLAGELSKIESSEDVPDALKRYETVFPSVIKDIGDIPSMFPQAASPQTGWGLTVRNTILWAMSKSRVYRLFLRGGDQNKDTLPTYDWVNT
ncbi:hypothetical protein CBS101457_006955 [Exobasidium rhododendri]|nr:hypothetical protein CBS101457_006955 [Exobasidium rhododendri]